MREIAPARYETDFALWAESQAAALREGRFNELDVRNLAEEVAALARRDRRDRIQRRAAPSSCRNRAADRDFPEDRGPELERATALAINREELGI